MLFLPEADLRCGDVYDEGEKLHEHKKPVVVAVSEGVKLADGRYVCELTEGIDFVDALDKQLIGTARYLAEKINRECGLKTRAIEFNSCKAVRPILCPTVDITEAFQAGGRRGQGGLRARPAR